MKLSVKEKILLIVLAVVIVLFGGIKLLVSPAYGEYKTKLSTLIVRVLSQTQAKNDVARAATIAGSEKASLDKADKAAAAILPSADTDSLNVWLCGIANSKGLTVSQISFSGKISTDIGNANNPLPAATESAGKSTGKYKLGDYAGLYKGASSSSSSSASDAKSSASKSAPASSSASSSSQTTPGAEGALLAVPVILNVTGTPANVYAFLDAVKATGKTAVVTDFSVQPTSSTINILCYGAEKPDGSDTYFAWAQPAPAGKNSIM